MSVEPLKSRLEDLMDKAPKEGSVAVIVRGVLNSITTLVNDVDTLYSKIKCVGEARGSCTEQYCDPNCGGIHVTRTNGSIHLNKHGNNAFGITIDDTGVTVSTSRAKITVSGSQVTIYRPSGTGWDSEAIDLEDFNTVREKNYDIKYVVRIVGGRVKKAVQALEDCRKRLALPC